MARDEAYRRAEQKIEEARRSGANGLDLSVRWDAPKCAPKLSELPESLCQLAQLRLLILSGNQLTALPESLCQLAQLQELNLSSNQLTALPESLCQLRQLQKLNLYHNRLTALPKSLDQLTHLQKLTLSRNQLTALPESLAQLTQLQTLELWGNQLTTLPESLAQLTQLQTLELWGNQLTALPESLAQLTQLQKLELSNNKLMALPKSLGQLAQLRSLNLSGNKLTALPESLGQLTQLQSLNLSNNELTTLPAPLGQLTQLRSLDLWGNQLTALPKSLGQLMHLQSLNLYGNKLTTLPESLGQLPQLQSLNLSNNELTTLPAPLGQLMHLQSLNLSGNKLTALPESLGQLMHLQSLNLSGNKLTTLPESLGRLAQLHELNLNNNRITVLPGSSGEFWRLHSLFVSFNRLAVLPEWAANVSQLRCLDCRHNELRELPESLGHLTQLQSLNAQSNQLTSLPESLGHLTQLQSLIFAENLLSTLPESLGHLAQLQSLDLSSNRLTALPESIGQLAQLDEMEINLRSNPLNPELNAAYEEGTQPLKRYLRAKAGAQVVLNEAKLILIGEGEVGKSCLLGALRGDSWEEDRPTTHGIEIKPVKVTDSASGAVITLNGWDFGGQRVYRPTHQLFFSAPAVYLVVWKPREGPQQGFVKEWIKLVKHREPDAKILVVATHGGPKERQPDIDRQESWDLFGKDTVIDFFLVESKPDEKTQEQKGIADLKQAIARVAASLPEMGRKVPKRWEEARNVLQSLLSLDAVSALVCSLVNDEKEACKRLKQAGEIDLPSERVLEILRDLILDENKAREELLKARLAYLPLERVLAMCRERQMDEEEAKDFVRISHRLGHLIHYEHDPALRDIVVLKPDWLATAISYVLDDKQTREGHGLVEFERLGQLWNDPARPAESRYDASLHPLFLRLMERFDLSYKVAVPTEPENAIGFWQRIGSLFGTGKRAPSDVSELHYTSLIAQLVPDLRPEKDLNRVWPPGLSAGDEQQVQICRIVETENGQSATAEGLFYQLIVRLHKYSLGRMNYKESVHWRRGLVLDDDYNGRALLEHIGNDVRITVRAPFPERFLSALTYEVKWLVESFWAGLRCDVMVPCIEPCGLKVPGTGLFEVQKLIESKRRRRPEYPCPVCNDWQDIDRLLRNAPARRTWTESDFREHLQAVRSTRERLASPGPHAFLSYVSQDAEIIQRLVDELTVRGIKVWFDRNDLKAGERWKNAIRTAIRQGGFFIACFSQEYGRRTTTFMNEELTLAIEEMRQRPKHLSWFIPIKLNECSIPDRDIGGGESLQDIQHLELFEDWSRGINLLAEAIQPAIQTERAEPRPEAKKEVDRVTQAFSEAGLSQFSALNPNLRRLISRVDDTFAKLMQSLTDEAKEGPRLFSFEPIDPGFFDQPTWVSEKFRVTLWCEHSRLPLPALNGHGDQRGAYELTLPRDWFVNAASFLGLLTGTLSLVLPVASSGTKLVLNEAAYKGIEKQLNLGQKSLEEVLKGGEMAGACRGDAPALGHEEEIKAQGAVLRQLQTWLKEKDPGFGGLVRVQNKRQEFLWVHPQFEKEY